MGTSAYTYLHICIYNVLYKLIHIHLYLGPFRTNDPKQAQKIARTKVVHTSGTFLEKWSNISLNHVPIYSQIQRI